MIWIESEVFPIAFWLILALELQTHLMQCYVLFIHFFCFRIFYGYRNFRCMKIYTFNHFVAAIKVKTVAGSFLLARQAGNTSGRSTMEEMPRRNVEQRQASRTGK